MDSQSGFDYMGAAGLGLSAFNAFNQYNYQNDALGLAKDQLNDARSAAADKKVTRAKWSSAFQNA